MGKTKKLSVETRAIIASLHNLGKSNRTIAAELKIPRRTVDYNVKKYASTRSFGDRVRSGRPRKTTTAEDKHIVLISKRDRRLTGPEIAAQINESRDLPLSISTVKRRLREAGLFGRVAVKKPLLRRQNKIKRLQWAKEHKNWTHEQWERVLWSDESKFEVFGSKRRIFVRRSKEERMLDPCVIPTVKHGGGSVMVWGCFGGQATGDLVKIEGILKKQGYKKIIKENVVRSGQRLIGRKFIFQHDNDPKHSSKLCKEYLKELERKNVLKVMTWPSQSPDLNPIELLWDKLDREVRKQCPTSTSHLWNILKDQWNQIDDDYLSKLLQRMPRLCTEIIKVKGGYIDESKI